MLELAEALPVGDVATLGALFDASYEGATRLFEMGAPAMTAMHDAMAARRVSSRAGRPAAGFGGCLVALVEPAAVPAFSAAVARAYEAATGIQPRIFAVEAGAGAGLLLEPAGSWSSTPARVFESRARRDQVTVPSASGEGHLDDLCERPAADLRQLVADARDRRAQLQQAAQVDGRSHEHDVGVDASSVSLSSRIWSSP